MGSLESGNDSDASAAKCSHKNRLEVCEESSCQAIRRLLAEKIVDPDRFRTTNSDTALEIAMDKRAISEWVRDDSLGEESVEEEEEPDEEAVKSDLERSLMNVFADRKTIRSAKRRRFVSEREADILLELLRAGGRLPYEEIASRIDWSRDTVRRDFRKLVGRFLKKRDRDDPHEAGSLIIKRIRGEKGQTYLIVREIRFGEFREWSAVTTRDKKQIARLRRQRPVHRVDLGRHSQPSLPRASRKWELVAL